MTSHDDKVPPSEQRGGTTPDADEAREKGDWVETSDGGIVPAELGGSDAPNVDDENPVLGRTVGGDEPATEEGIDLTAGDNADATRDGGQNRPEGAEPDLRDAGAGPRQVDVDAAS
jgi:hypothetical protein